MNDAQRVRLEMVRRAGNFLKTRQSEFAAGSKGLQLIATLESAVGEAEAFLQQQQSGASGQQGGTLTKAQAYLALQDDIEAIARTARALGDEIEGIEARFRRPRSAGDEALKTAARTFLQDAAPLKNQFIAYEMPADFLEDLQDDLTAFENAERAQDSGFGSRVEGTKGLDDAVTKGVAAVRKLDAIIRNKYRANAEVLAAWTSASHIERAARKKPPAAS